VANVIHNRFLSHRTQEFGRTYEEIIFKPKQFSGVGSDLWQKLDMPNLLTQREEKIYAECLDLAYTVLNNTIEDNTKGAVLFYNPSKTTPAWNWNAIERTMIIGKHHFYRYK